MLETGRLAIAWSLGSMLLCACFEESQDVGDSDTTTATSTGTSDDTVGSGTTPGSSGTSADSTTTSTTTTTSTGTSTTTNPTGSTGGSSCANDAHEPNDTVDQAHDLGQIGDFDGDGDTVLGVLDGSDDVDWFTYEGQDNNLAMVDPTRTLTASGSVTLCKYAACLDLPLETEVVCPMQTTEAQMDGGTKGCCASEGFYMPIACSGSDDAARIFFSLQTAENACINYSVAYHY